jgi:hypothetical protein
MKLRIRSARYLHNIRHPGESRDPLTRINRAALLALMEFIGPRLSPG